jgi:peroxiredoxin Q/BCP
MAFPKKDPNLQPLPVGTVAPDFSCIAAPTGDTLALADFLGQPFVLVFYPRDQTPGCTKQLCALTDDIERFASLNCRVLASNPGSLVSHQRFIEKQQYALPILVDEEKAMATAYKCVKEEGGIQRTVYVVDASGRICFAEQGMAKHETLFAMLEGLSA